MQLNRRVAQVQPSPTLVLNQKANTLKAEGKSIVNLTAGEPDFRTPEHICEAARRAMAEGKTRYTPSLGILELRQAVVEKMKREYGRQVKSSQVIVTTGAKQALYHLCQALLDEGDEAMILAPYWVSYPDMVTLAGGKPVILPLNPDTGFALDLAALEKAISSRTKLLFINSPSNPSGVTYGKGDLLKLQQILEKYPQVTVVTDDIYEKLIYDGASFWSLGMAGKFAEERVLIVNGVSKSYAMTGWRIGYAVGPEPLIKAMDILQSQSTSGATSIAQWAAVEALQGKQDEVEHMRQAFERRRNLFWEGLTGIPELSCPKPTGAFYTFFDVRAYLGRKANAGKRLQDDVELAAYILESVGVATVPGSVFGMAGFLRASFATSEEQLKEGLLRLSKAFSLLA